MKVSVDAGVCTACGLCEGICPNAFMSCGDIAMVIVEQVNEADQSDCRKAAENCPVAAIALAEKPRPELIPEEEFLGQVEVLNREFRRYVRRRVKNPSDYDDVLADAVETAWEQREKFTPGTNFRSWMFRILTNKSFAHNRNSRRFSTPLSESKEPNASSDSNARSLENINMFLDRLSDQVAQAVESMRPPEQSCILLKAMRNCTYKEIAVALDIPLGTVMTHLARGRARAKQALGCASLGEFMNCNHDECWAEDASPRPLQTPHAASAG